MASYPSYDANLFATTDGELFCEPGRLAPVRAGIGDEGVHDRRRARRGRDHDDATRSSTTTILRSARPHPECRPRRTTRTGTGRSPPADVLALSNNVGAAKIGLTLGGEKLYEAFRRFGFGEPDRDRAGGEASRRGLGSGRAQCLGRPDGRAERLRAGAEPDGRPARRRLRLLRQRWAARDAARRRRLDRSGRHLPRRRAATGGTDHARGDGRARWSSC